MARINSNYTPPAASESFASKEATDETMSVRKKSGWSSISEAKSKETKTPDMPSYTGDLSSIKEEGGNTVVELDSGLQAEISEEGIKFSEVNNGRSMAAWHSRPIGEVKFADLEKGLNTFSGDYGMITFADGREVAAYKTTPDKVMSALYEGLKGAEDLDEAGQTLVDSTLEDIEPLIDISARGTDEDKSALRGMGFGGISSDLDGNITVDYQTRAGNSSNKEASLEGDKLTVTTTKTYEYMAGHQEGGVHVTDEDGFPFTKVETPKTSIEKTKVDLSDPENWTALENREVVDLKRLLDGVNPENLTATEKVDYENLLGKVDTALEIRNPVFEEATLQNIKAGKGGEVTLDYIQGKASDPTSEKTAVVKGDEIHITYTEQDFGKPGEISNRMVKYEEKTEVLDLTDIDSWTPEQQQLGFELKTALQNTGDVNINGERKELVDDLLNKLDTVSEPPKEMQTKDIVQLPKGVTIGSDLLKGMAMQNYGNYASSEAPDNAVEVGTEM